MKLDRAVPPKVLSWGPGNQELQQQIVKDVLEEADGQSIDELAAERDEMLFGLLAVRAEYGSATA